MSNCIPTTRKMAGYIFPIPTAAIGWCGWIVPGTMVRVVRGRIKDGKWVDQEIIWSVHKDHYTPVPDAVAAGRLAFDRRGHLYISIGGKNTYDKLHLLDTPFGKIHRVREDGSVPKDNPFWVAAEERSEASTVHTVWSIGHRTGQGLDGHPKTAKSGTLKWAPAAAMKSIASSPARTMGGRYSPTVSITMVKRLRLARIWGWTSRSKTLFCRLLISLRRLQCRILSFTTGADFLAGEMTCWLEA